MAVLAALLAVAITGVATLLALVSALAAKRTRALRFWFAAAAFLAFAVRGLLIVLDGAGVRDSALAWNEASIVFDAVILALLYLAIVKG